MYIFPVIPAMHHNVFGHMAEHLPLGVLVQRRPLCGVEEYWRSSPLLSLSPLSPLFLLDPLSVNGVVENLHVLPVQAPASHTAGGVEVVERRHEVEHGGGAKHCTALHRRMDTNGCSNHSHSHNHNHNSYQFLNTIYKTSCSTKILRPPPPASGQGKRS